MFGKMNESNLGFDPKEFPFPLGPEDLKMLTIEKPEAVFYMINTVLNLWFRRRDVVSEHLLAASAADVLKGCGKAKGVTSHVFNKEMEKLLGKKLRLAMNFFKHANTDPETTLLFAPVTTEFFLIDAVQMYGKIYGSLSALMHTFRAWFIVMRGRHIEEAKNIELFLPNGVRLADVQNLDREEFLDEIMPRFVAQYPDSDPV
jgi:hypothetical protein